MTLTGLLARFVGSCISVRVMVARSPNKEGYQLTTLATLMPKDVISRIGMPTDLLPLSLLMEA
jgi:hypothetical protein